MYIATNLREIMKFNDKYNSNTSEIYWLFSIAFSFQKIHVWLAIDHVAPVKRNIQLAVQNHTDLITCSFKVYLSSNKVRTTWKKIEFQSKKKGQTTNEAVTVAILQHIAIIKDRGYCTEPYRIWRKWWAEFTSARSKSKLPIPVETTNAYMIYLYGVFSTEYLWTCNPSKWLGLRSTWNNFNYTF